MAPIAGQPVVRGMLLAGHREPFPFLLLLALRIAVIVLRHIRRHSKSYKSGATSIRSAPAKRVLRPTGTL